MILYLRYCRTGVLFYITVHVKDQYVTTYDDVILVKPNRIYVPRIGYSRDVPVCIYSFMSGMLDMRHDDHDNVHFE